MQNSCPYPRPYRFSGGRHVSRRRFREAIRSLEEQVSGLQNYEIILRIQRGDTLMERKFSMNHVDGTPSMR